MKFRYLIALVVILCPMVATAATPGSAKGTITFNGKSKNLLYAYAWKEPDGFEKGVMDTVVLLTDTKLDDKTMVDRVSLIQAARANKFSGVAVTINPKGEVLNSEFYGGGRERYFDASGSQWEKKAVTAASIEGKLSAPESHFAETTYAFSATFKAPIGPARNN